MSSTDKSVIALECIEVVYVGSQPDVAIGAHRKQCGLPDSKNTSGPHFEMSYLPAQTGAGPKRDGRLKQLRGASLLL